MARGNTAAPVVVIGAGMAGLTAAVDLAAAGADVLVLEKEAAPGGKMRDITVGGRPIAGGPTVMTMRWVLDGLLARAGTTLEDIIGVKSAQTLARHGWRDGAQLDLFADIDASVEAIAAFSDRRNADGYRKFCSASQAMFETLKDTFIAASRPSPVGLSQRVGMGNVNKLVALRPFSTFWDALSDFFTDPRLRQLFGRYATYVGSSPFSAPATLMLVAHVEQDGVLLMEGGMHGLARALEGVGARLGAEFRYGSPVNALTVSGGKVTGVTLATGEEIEASAVVYNGDASALPAMVRRSAAVRLPKPVPAADRSLSAMVWTATAKTSGFPLAHHSVFFSDAYKAEFEQIFRQRKVPDDPTVYICAQDRSDSGALTLDATNTNDAERMLILINAPADGDTHDFPTEEVTQCLDRTRAQLDACGLKLENITQSVTTPADFAQLFPGSGGALYGRASHGWMASFARTGTKTKLPGLYLAGGSVHPGAGVPMAAQSGILAAESLAKDLGLTRKSRPVATSGGMRTG